MVILEWEILRSACKQEARSKKQEAILNFKALFNATDFLIIFAKSWLLNSWKLAWVFIANLGHKVATDSQRREDSWNGSGEFREASNPSQIVCCETITIPQRNTDLISMTTITIDNKEYDVDKLSQEAKAQLVSIQFCDQELQRLQAQAAAYQTARQAYAKALNQALNPIEHMGDKFTFN